MCRFLDPSADRDRHRGLPLLRHRPLQPLRVDQGGRGTGPAGRQERLQPEEQLPLRAQLAHLARWVLGHVTHVPWQGGPSVVSLMSPGKVGPHVTWRGGPSVVSLMTPGEVGPHVPWRGGS